MTHKTQRIEPSVSQMTRRLELSFRNVSKNQNSLEKNTRRIDFLKNINQNKETFDDSQNWTFVKKTVTHRTELFFIWFTELNPSFQHDA